MSALTSSSGKDRDHHHDHPVRDVNELAGEITEIARSEQSERVRMSLGRLSDLRGLHRLSSLCGFHPNVSRRASDVESKRTVGRLSASARLSLLSATVLCALCVFAAPSLAASEGSGWALTARTYPTNLILPKSETQELSLKAEGGSFILVFQGGETASIPYGSSVASVQSALNALPSIGGVGGSVTVSGGPEHDLVSFGGALSNMLTAELEAFGGELEGVEPSASVTVTEGGATSGSIVLDEFNVGAGASHGTITVTDTLPVGLKAKDAGEFANLSHEAGVGFGVNPKIEHNLWDCTGDGPGPAPKVAGASVVTCVNDAERLPSIDGGAGLPAGPAAEAPRRQPPIAISVEADKEVSGLTNHATIVGGGAPSVASAQNPITVSSSPAPFGFHGWDTWFSNADGTIDTQAGSHPYAATFTYTLASALNSSGEGALPGGEPRNMEVQLPPGFIGNPLVVGQCSRTLLAELNCPQNSQVGITEVNTVIGADLGFQVFNMKPPSGVAAEFGFNLSNILVLIDSTARTSGDYGIKTTIPNVPQREVVDAMLTLWGEPQAASHNPWRNGITGGCSQEAIEHPKADERSACLAPQFQANNKPFLTLPTSCGAPQPFLIRVLSGWQDPNAKAEATVLSHDATGNPVGFTGCENLAFGPGLTLTPEVASTDSPTGLTADAPVNLGGLEEKGLLAPANIRHVTATLPEGVSVNPGQASGLQACQETQEQSAIGTEEPAHCPAASKIGTARIKSPLLESAPEKEFEGTVYLLQSNPPEIHLLVAASADGVNLKLVGIAHLNTATGQIETTFGQDPAVEASDPFLKGHLALPDLPASDFKLSFEGGPKAALVTPPGCGTYTGSATFSSQASPFISDFQASPAFAITSGVGGSSCPAGALPFAPVMEDPGPTSTEAGAFSGFTQLLSRGDGQQRIQSFSFTEPQGLSGLISGVALCAEAQANAGTCPKASQIGHAIVQSGPGSSPLTLPQPGGPEIPIYLTGKYKGAPFGLSIPAPIVAGPFNLGTITTRAQIAVDPHTAQITISTDPLPQIVDGVPTDLRSIYAVIDRPNFLFNPTNCTPSQFVGSATSVQGASAPLSSRFAIGACGALKFSPTIKMQVPAKSSKANGAGLFVKISYPKNSIGAQSWFNEAKLSFPKQLPARLTTIQKACTSQTFEANPASCPPASLIGHVTVHTPVLPVPLTGPAYFVSFGAAKFPDVVFVLQGYGVTVILRGETQIKNGITSATFRGTPDVPFEDIEVSIPPGPFSEFAANLPQSAKGSFCGQKMSATKLFKAQNGLTQQGSVPIQVTGCANAIEVRSRKVKGRTLTLTLTVPTAGKLTAGGRNLSKAQKKAQSSETITLKLHATKKGKLHTKVHLSFKPAKGKTLAKSLGV
jgi:hypothetical protein